MAGVSGVYPVYNIKFKIGTEGKSSTDEQMLTIADMEEFSISIDGTVQTWTPMTTDGWQRSLMTGKSFSVSLKGKRNVGDPGNDYIAGTTFADGLDCSTKAKIEFPDGSTLAFDCVVSVTNNGGGSSTDVAPLEFDLQGDGKPVYTAAA